jgi:hypothetical protein
MGTAVNIAWRQEHPGEPRPPKKGGCLGSNSQTALFYLLQRFTEGESER